MYNLKLAIERSNAKKSRNIKIWNFWKGCLVRLDCFFYRKSVILKVETHEI